MFSISSILAIGSLLLTVTASPIPSSESTSLNIRGSLPPLPCTNGPRELLSPSAGLSLKHITLGRGIQNYTCTAGASTPVAIGAIATLFDITPLASSPFSSYLLKYLPAIAVYIPLPTYPKINNIQYPGTDRLARIGDHYFDGSGTPVFDLNAYGELFRGKKLDDVAAPTAASPGPSGSGAVAWLKLGDKGGSAGISEVYRVVTAGGNPGPCKKVGVFSVEYATEYWMYG